MWDPVPWMVSNGAVHSSNVARNVAFGAFAGQEGVVQPRGLEVRQLTVPGPQVQVYPGTVAIKNRATGATDEMYVGQNRQLHPVDISPNLGSTIRYDLVVARVEDPNEPGTSWAAPESVEDGPYIFTRVIQNVPASTRTASQLGLGHSMIAIARIAIPPSTGTITQAMITDLRFLAAGRTARKFAIARPASSSVGGPVVLNAEDAYDLPSWAYTSVEIPEWATHMRGAVNVNDFLALLYTTSTSGFVQMRLTVGGSVLDFPQGVWTMDPFLIVNVADGVSGGDAIPIPPSIRGKGGTLHVRLSTVYGTTYTMDMPQGMAIFDVEFYQLPESNV